jgi:c-di-GMP-binding flagellar brake protein YcgR
MNESQKDIIERRRFRRVEADILYRSPRLAPRKRPIHDISLGGVRISCDEELPANTQLEMEFFLPNGYALAAIARVVWIRKRPEGSESPFEAGLEFMHLNPDAAHELEKFLEVQ